MQMCHTFLCAISYQFTEGIRVTETEGQIHFITPDKSLNLARRGAAIQ